MDDGRLEREREIARLYGEGVSTNDIAKRLGVRLVEVIGVVRDAGLVSPVVENRPVSPPLETLGRSAALPDPVVPTPPPAEPREPPPPRVRPGRRPGGSRPARTAHGAALRHGGTPPGEPPTAALSGPVEPPPDADDDPGEFVQRAGRPRGWLVTEAEFAEMSRRVGGRFVDVTFKTKGGATSTATAPERDVGAKKPRNS